MQFHNSRWKGGEKNVPSIMGVWIFSGITQSRRTFIFSHCFPPPITVYFSVGEKWGPETPNVQCLLKKPGLLDSEKLFTSIINTHHCLI